MKEFSRLNHVAGLTISEAMKADGNLRSAIFYWKHGMGYPKELH